MLRKALFNIIRQEQRQLADEIAEEQRRPAPDTGRLSVLRREEYSLRREFELYAEP